MAGSERVSLSGATGDTLIETQNINSSLSSLGNVLSALSQYHSQGVYGKSKNPPVVPYRDSKLTFFLKDSLGGNSKTLMIANVRTPSKFQMQTNMILMYAARAKNIKNRTIINTDEEGNSKTNALLVEIETLKGHLKRRENEFEHLSRNQEWKSDSQIHAARLAQVRLLLVFQRGL